MIKKPFGQASLSMNGEDEMTGVFVVYFLL